MSERRAFLAAVTAASALFRQDAVSRVFAARGGVRAHCAWRCGQRDGAGGVSVLTLVEAAGSAMLAVKPVGVSNRRSSDIE